MQHLLKYVVKVGTEVVMTLAVENLAVFFFLVCTLWLIHIHFSVGSLQGIFWITIFTSVYISIEYIFT